MISFETGNLFDRDFEFDAIGHGVNCRGVMGSGIAVAFKAEYPLMFRDYQDQCNADYLNLGQVFVYDRYTIGSGPRFIYNIASQDLPGKHGDLYALEAALHFVRFHAERKGLERVGLPRIGCGIAGLDWEEVKRSATRIIGMSRVDFTFVSLED